MPHTIAAPAQRTPTMLRSINTPLIGAHWPEQAGDFAGAGRAVDGTEYLLIAGPEADSELNHAAAEAWAKGLSIEGLTDFTLPTRRDLALMFANVPEKFQREFYWSSEPGAGDPDYAWGQWFDDGGQSYYHKSNECRVRAVRRQIIR